MARPKRWTGTKVRDGVEIVTLSSWKYFPEFIAQKLLDYRTYVYRGHASENWKLESTLDRELKRLQIDARPAARMPHLQNFKYAARGRRGPNPRELLDDNEWWALGQHHGLATPLLDWTESPFVALFFSFWETDTSGSEYRAVWGLSQNSVNAKSKEIADAARQEKKKGRPDIVEIVRPLSDENSRLVSQRGLFVRGPDGMPIEEWVSAHFKGDYKTWRLFKIRIPNKERTVCLRFLNRMNINHLSLFPDLFGATRYCNTDLVIKDY